MRQPNTVFGHILILSALFIKMYSAIRYTLNIYIPDSTRYLCVYIYLFLTTEHIPNRKICPVNHFKHYPKNIMKICLSRLEHDATVYVCLVSGPDICKQTSDIQYTVASAPAVTSTDFMIFMPRFRVKALQY